MKWPPTADGVLQFFLAMILLAYFLAIAVPAGINLVQGAPVFFGEDATPWGALIQATTVLGGAFGIFLLWIRANAAEKTLRLQQEAEVTTQFERAASMIDKSSHSNIVGAATILVRLAADYPDRYQAVSRDLLAAKLNDLGTTARAGLDDKIREAGQEADPNGMPQPITHHASELAPYVMAVIGDIPPIGLNRYQTLQRGFFADLIFYEEIFEEVGFLDCVLENTVVENCNVGSLYQVSVAQHLQFINCNFSAMVVELSGGYVTFDAVGKPVQPVLRFVDCRIDGQNKNDGSMLMNFGGRNIQHLKLTGQYVWNFAEQQWEMMGQSGHHPSPSPESGA